MDGDFGCPLFKVNDYGVFKWSCTFRGWGGVMERPAPALPRLPVPAETRSSQQAFSFPYILRV